MNTSDNGYQPITIGTIGTVVQRAVPSVLYAIVPEVSVGTVIVYNTSSATGGAATNRVLTFTGGTSVQDCFPKILNAQCNSGIVTVSTGTPICTLLVT